MREYKEKFEVYSCPLRISEHRYLLGVFLNGLKRNIRTEMELHRPSTLAEMFTMAKMVKKRIRVEEEEKVEDNAERSRSATMRVQGSSWDRMNEGERSKGMVRVVTPSRGNSLSSRESGSRGMGTRAVNQPGGNVLAASSSC